MLALTLAALVVGAVGDTEMVGSSVHQASVPAPHDLQGAATGPEGYHHSHSTRGGDGYKHFDSFHKKDGDAFGYEKHYAFGNGDKGDDGGAYHESTSYNSGDKGSLGTRQNPKVTAYHYESKSGTPRDYSNYDPETYEGDYTEVAPRTVPKAPSPPRRQGDARVAREHYQAADDAGRGRRLQRQQPDDTEYDYSGEQEGEEDDGGFDAEFESEGGGFYDGEEDSEADYYY
ncbi:hypothetical protein J6590_057165 [Homalodisca vitripennis]|nr:hypothetical protein J6590_057165 [Homalodisca vitripennis]